MNLYELRRFPNIQTNIPTMIGSYRIYWNKINCILSRVPQDVAVQEVVTPLRRIREPKGTIQHDPEGSKGTKECRQSSLRVLPTDRPHRRIPYKDGHHCTSTATTAETNNALPTLLYFAPSNRENDTNYFNAVFNTIFQTINSLMSVVKWRKDDATKFDLYNQLTSHTFFVIGNFINKNLYQI